MIMSADGVYWNNPMYEDITGVCVYESNQLIGITSEIEEARNLANFVNCSAFYIPAVYLICDLREALILSGKFAGKLVKDVINDIGSITKSEKIVFDADSRNFSVVSEDLEKLRISSGGSIYDVSIEDLYDAYMSKYTTYSDNISMESIVDTTLNCTGLSLTSMPLVDDCFTSHSVQPTPQPLYSAAELNTVFSVSVKDFGAIGDGVADDADAIKKAMEYAKYISLGDVIFPPGIYRIS